MIIGMDFGTTNTGAALYDGKTVRLLALDPAGSNPQVCRSAIYMTRTGDYFLGSTALNNYFDQNIGRATRFKKVWVGEIVQIFAELPIFYRDVYVFEDEFSPGRLFTSIKTALRSREYYGTAFRGSWFSASDLVAIFLMGMKMQLEQQLDTPVNEVVLGRPVHFSGDSIEDQIAQSRLLDAAFKAGFEKVYLEYEPVAAALAYERQLARREIVLVFDFGGGTLDFTIMQVGGRGPRQVLATGGVPIAGDVFDQRLFRATVPRHLGEGLEYTHQRTHRPIPAHIFDTLAQPAEILSLNTPQNLEMLQQIHAGSPDPDKTHALIKVISSNYALMIFDLVERTKRQLSDQHLSRLEVSTTDFSFHELVSRTTFERAIAGEVEAIQVELLATIKRAGLPPEKIDRVIRTGGSSQIPLFVNLLDELFGFEKVQAIDIFSSVTSGLAIRGRQIQDGKVDLPVFTPQSEARSSEHTVDAQGDETSPRKNQPVEKQATPVDLAGVLKRLQVRQEAVLEPQNLPQAGLFLLTEGEIYCAGISPLTGLPVEPVCRNWMPPGLMPHLTKSDESHHAFQFCLVGLEQSLLILTNKYKFISRPVRDLYLAQQADPEGVLHSLPLDFDEKPSAMLSWNPQILLFPAVCMLTAAGQGRVFDTAMLAEAIARRPFFQLERRYTGIPVQLLYTDPSRNILVGTDHGRVGRGQTAEMTVQPLDLIRLRSTEWYGAAASMPDGDLAWALNSHGQAVSVNPASLPGGTPAGQRAVYIRRNFPIIALISHTALAGRGAWAVSSSGALYHLNDASIPLDETGSPVRLLHLAAGERLFSVLLQIP